METDKDIMSEFWQKDTWELEKISRSKDKKRSEIAKFMLEKEREGKRICELLDDF